MIPIEENLVDIVWGTEQPKLTSNPIITLDLIFSGETVADKWTKVKNQLNEMNCDALVVSALDEIACMYIHMSKINIILTE